MEHVAANDGFTEQKMGGQTERSPVSPTRQPRLGWLVWNQSQTFWASLPFRRTRAGANAIRLTVYQGFSCTFVPSVALHVVEFTFLGGFEFLPLRRLFGILGPILVPPPKSQQGLPAPPNTSDAVVVGPRGSQRRT
jgi:hypothetical protein